MFLAEFYLEWKSSMMKKANNLQFSYDVRRCPRYICLRWSKPEGSVRDISRLSIYNAPFFETAREIGPSNRIFNRVNMSVFIAKVQLARPVDVTGNEYNKIDYERVILCVDNTLKIENTMGATRKLPWNELMNIYRMMFLTISCAQNLSCGGIEVKANRKFVIGHICVIFWRRIYE